jgi:membrane protein YqaA with SNARE-associated domain|tara:strand:+ start:463 stop:864 length:402 start_codon:yes stop_codon:yes gene_type:complete
MVATIIPFGSEAYFITLLSMDKYNNFLLLLFASAGNILGSVFNWICGYYVNYFIKKSWFPINNNMIDRGNKIFKKYGKWSLLLSWVPFIGDPITFVAGTLRYSIIPFIILVSIGKFGRYLVIYLSLSLALGIF